jgi:hypothetical protein
MDMARMNMTRPRQRRVWRVTANAPFGEYVDPDALPRRPVDPPNLHERGWLLSSFELSDGLDVKEEPDTIPAELFDTLFKRRSPP